MEKACLAKQQLIAGLFTAADHLLAMAQDDEQMIARIKGQVGYARSQTGMAELHVLGDRARLLRAQAVKIRRGQDLLTPQKE